MVGDDYDYLVEMYGERTAKRMNEAAKAGAVLRECCETDSRMWHARPCTVSGPTGPEPRPPSKEYWVVRGVRVVEPVPSTRCGGDGCRGCAWCEREPVTGLDFGYYRTCCATAPGSVHWQGCGTNFFAPGQTVIKPDLHGLAYPWERAPLLIREDTVSSDRTFENETRLH